MLRILNNLPTENIYVGVSGGPDSMAILHFLNKTRNVTALMVDHGTGFHDTTYPLVSSYCESNKIHLEVFRPESTEIPKGESPEAFWRSIRYDQCFHTKDLPVITGHNLDDQVENWIMTSLKGNPRLIPYKNKNVVRPFLLTKKSILEDYCHTHAIPYVIDPSNLQGKYPRSVVRNNIIPEALKVNPGLYRTIASKVISLVAK